MLWVVVALLYFVLAAVAPSLLSLFISRTRPDFRTLSLSLRIVFVVIALTCLAATSYVHVESDEIAVLNKIYGTTSLPGEHIIATNGEKGPQAEILTPGWHPWFLVNVIYQVENKKVVSIPSGKYGFLNAKDGAPLRPDQFLSDAFPPAQELDMLDAEYFLIHAGQRGPQTTILTPGNYRLNTYLWDLSVYSAVDVAEGFVGVVKSNVVDSVHFGNLAADKPASCQQKMVSTNASGEAVAAKEAKTDEGKLTATLVPVGGLPEIENNIMVPTIRSIVRNVVGAQGRHVLDLADNRAELEHAVEDAIRPEGLRAGIVIKEVKFGDPALPPELLVSRLRQQLADQLQVTYQQEQKAQTQRIETEKARATAEQQHQLVEAVIGVQVSEQNKNAAKLHGEGQKLELEEIAQGQRAQADVLGQDRVLTITLVQQLLKTIQEKPEVVSLIGKLVPQTVVSTGGQSTGLDSAAATFGALLNNGGGAPPALTGPSVKK